MIIKSTLLLFLLAAPVFCLAQPTDRYEELTGEQDEFDAVEKEWVEGRYEIPPLPEEKEWTPVQIDALPVNQHAYLHMKSLQRSDKDLVVRYWLLLRSDGGGYSAAYEGTRCATEEYITYAWGREKRQPQVRKVKQPRWKPIGIRKQGNYREELTRGIFCSGAVPRTRRQIEQSVQGRYEKMNPFDNWTNDD